MATQSLSSLRAALPGETWRALVQTFRTKIFLALNCVAAFQTFGYITNERMTF